MVYRDISFAHEVTELAEKITASDGFMRMSHIMCLLHRWSTTTPSSTLLTGEPPLLRSEDASSLGRAYRYIYANFQNVFTLAQVAEYAGMHPSALSRAFKRLFQRGHRDIMRKSESLRGERHRFAQIGDPRTDFAVAVEQGRCHRHEGVEYVQPALLPALRGFHVVKIAPQAVERLDEPP